MFLNFRRACGSLVALAGLSVSASAALVVIDDFTVPVTDNVNVAQTGGGPNSNPMAAVFSAQAGISNSKTIGGVRELFAQNTTSNVDYSATADRYLTSGGGNSGTFGNNSAKGHGIGSFNYDGVNNLGSTAGASFPGVSNSGDGAVKGVVGNGLNDPMNAGGGVDLTSNGTNTMVAFKNFSVVGSTGPTITITVNTTTGVLTSVVTTSDLTPSFLGIEFTSFQGTGSFTNVTGIQIYFEATQESGARPGSDINFTLFAATSGVPEPSTVVLGLMAGVGLVLTQVRRKRS